jgi:hypothetical protein
MRILCFAPSCLPAGELILQYVAPALNDDPMAQCLTSVKLELFNDCSVRSHACPGRSGRGSQPSCWLVCRTAPKTHE